MLPRRWVVERTFAWLGRCRRLAKDWEKSIESATAFAHLASTRMLTRRIARHCQKNYLLNRALRDREVVLGPGELFVVPRGIEHCPVAEEETHLLLIAPAGTPNTGEEKTAAIKTAI